MMERHHAITSVPLGGGTQPSQMSLMSSGTDVFFVHWADHANRPGRRIKIVDGLAQYWIPGTPQANFQNCVVVHPATGSMLFRTKHKQFREPMQPAMLQLKCMWEVAEANARREALPAAASVSDILGECFPCGGAECLELHQCPLCMQYAHGRCLAKFKDTNFMSLRPSLHRLTLDEFISSTCQVARATNLTWAS